MTRIVIAPIVGALVLLTSSSAFAQWGRPDPRPSYGGVPYADARRAAYDNGYREGLEEGGKDGRGGDRFEYRDERDFQRGDYGYHRSLGDRERYQQSFRAGFADGYSSGYRRHARGYGGSGGYGGYGDSYGFGQYLSPFDLGARDGYEKGMEDARDGDRLDGRRHKWYREGDRHYEGRYGSREQYKDEYRRGFLIGYERGYRGGSYR